MYDRYFYGTWHFRASHGNTGLLYARDDYGDEWNAGSWGTVCRGNRDEAIIGENARQIGELMCISIGYGKSLQFIGSKYEYETFLQKSDSKDCSVTKTDVLDIDECLPDYKIVGGSCPAEATSIEECSFRLKSAGGSCLRGQSDVYIHCAAGNLVPGTWTAWVEQDFCRPQTDYFKQRYRKCVSKSDAPNTWCPGSWLELLLCGDCPKVPEIIDDYNAEYYEDSSVYDYYGRKRRNAENDFCNCAINTSYPTECAVANMSSANIMFLCIPLVVFLVIIALFIYWQKYWRNKPNARDEAAVNLRASRVDSRAALLPGKSKPESTV